MEYLDLDLSETDSKNNLSDIFSSDSTVDTNMTGGGFFSDLFGNNKLEKALLEAAKLKKYDIVEFLVDRDIISFYGCQDSDGYTILHYLVSAPNPNIKLIEKITKSKNIKSFINTQNRYGDTPLILAVKSGHHDICSKLIECGANKKIKNKEGLHVDTETEMPIEQNLVSVQPLKKKYYPNKNYNTLNYNTSNYKTSFNDQKSSDCSEILNPIIKLLQENLYQKQKQELEQENLTSEPIPINLTETDIATFNIKNDNQNQLDDSEQFIKKLEQEFNKQEHLHGGGCGCSETDKLVSDIEKYFITQSGGKKSNKIKNGQRKIRHVDSSIDSSNKDYDRGHDLSRMLNDQTDIIIKKIIESISTIIVDNKKIEPFNEFKELKDVKEAALAIKAILWKKAKELNPKLKTALETATAVENMVNLDTLKELTKKEIISMMQTLQKYYENNNNKKQHNKKQITSTTSSEEVQSESNISETSA